MSDLCKTETTIDCNPYGKCTNTYMTVLNCGFTEVDGRVLADFHGARIHWATETLEERDLWRSPIPAFCLKWDC